MLPVCAARLGGGSGLAPMLPPQAAEWRLQCSLLSGSGLVPMLPVRAARLGGGSRLAPMLPPQAAEWRLQCSLLSGLLVGYTAETQCQ